MIALLLLAAAPPVPPAMVAGTPLAALERQALPERGCAAYLFTTGETRTFVAMASAEAGTLRLSLDGLVLDVSRTAQTGAGGFGFATSTDYRGGDVAATLDLTIATRADLAAGAAVPSATLRIDRAGKDGVVLPLIGLIGCA